MIIFLTPTFLTYWQPKKKKSPKFGAARGLGIFFTTASRTALGPTQPPMQRVPGALSLVVKQPGREANHSPPCSAEVKEWVELHLHSPKTRRDNFTFSFKICSCTLLIVNSSLLTLRSSGYEAIWCCGRIPTFRRTLVPPPLHFLISWIATAEGRSNTVKYLLFISFLCYFKGIKIMAVSIRPHLGHCSCVTVFVAPSSPQVMGPLCLCFMLTDIVTLARLVWYFHCDINSRKKTWSTMQIILCTVENFQWNVHLPQATLDLYVQMTRLSCNEYRDERESRGITIR
jgi:hypothetical protein